MIVRRLGLIAVLAVAGCAAPPATTTTSVVPPISAVAAVSREPSAEPVKAAPKATEEPRLVGLVSRDIEGLLGQPRFVRRDGPAQIWQYGTGACTLNLFLYREGPAFKVRHVEFRDRNADLAVSGGCNGPIVSMLQSKTP